MVILLEYFTLVLGFKEKLEVIREMGLKSCGNFRHLEKFF